MIKRWVVLLIPTVSLLILSISTSFTMVVDAGEWYGDLYQDLSFLVHISGQYRGLLFALILEGFLFMTVVVKLPLLDGKYHPANYALTFLSALVVVIIGFGSYQGITADNRYKLTTDEKLVKLVDQKQSAIDQNKIQQQIFSCTDDKGEATSDCRKQPTNYALAVRQGNELQTQHDQLTKDSGYNTTEGRVRLVFLALAKAALLGANVMCLWLIGWYYRRWKGLESSYVTFPTVFGTPESLENAKHEIQPQQSLEEVVDKVLAERAIKPKREPKPEGSAPSSPISEPRVQVTRLNRRPGR